MQLFACSSTANAQAATSLRDRDLLRADWLKVTQLGYDWR
jgi:hypothetical protein